MFGIGGVIMMLDFRMNGCVGDKFVRLGEVVIAVDVLLRIRISDIAMCIEYSASLGKRTLGIVLCGNAGVVDASVMATISKYQTFIDFKQV